MLDESDGRAAAGQLAELAGERGLTVAVAESLTCGAVASRLGQAPSSSDWFAGGVVAYSPRVKAEVLGTTGTEVVTRQAAEQMARGVGELLHADVAVATTGVGGPGSQEGKPAGTVWIGVWSRLGARAECFEFPGGPEDVVERSTAQAVAAALEEARAVAAGE